MTLLVAYDRARAVIAEAKTVKATMEIRDQLGHVKLHAKQVICMIRPENRPSRRVAERNGMAAGKLVFWHDFNHLIYSISREQWFVAFQKEREAEKSRKEGADGDVSVFLDSV